MDKHTQQIVDFMNATGAQLTHLQSIRSALGNAVLLCQRLDMLEVNDAQLRERAYDNIDSLQRLYDHARLNHFEPYAQNDA